MKREMEERMEEGRDKERSGSDWSGEGVERA